uniref:Lysophosphatidic acid receptor 2 n=1 Tax=Hucho hucho TaxID=62062 RepID=A0A4W5JM68_9TELE
MDNYRNVTFFYEYVGKDISRDWRVRDCVVVVLGLTVCLIMILSNIMVMAAILINRRFHFPIYFLLANMAAADLLAGLAYTNLVLNTGPWTIRLSEQQWFIRNALVDMSLTASVANLLAVAVERHQTIIAMQLHSKMTNRRVVLLIVCIWAVAIIMGLVPSMGWNCECQLSDCSIIAPLYSQKGQSIFFSRYMIFWRRKGKRMSQQTSHRLRHNETVVNLMKTISICMGSNHAFQLCFLLCSPTSKNVLFLLLLQRFNMTLFLFCFCPSVCLT